MLKMGQKLVKQLMAPLNIGNIIVFKCFVLADGGCPLIPLANARCF